MTFPKANDPLVGEFDGLPAEHRVEIYGVKYARWRLDQGGELYVTRFGWARREHILPESWFLAKRFCSRGERLDRGTGTLYRVPTFDGEGRRVDLVVKFSRFAQDVNLQLDERFGLQLPDSMDARWNDPFEEFGRLMELRRGRYGPSQVRILTKRPLAIYCPSEECPVWQLGRHQYEVELQQTRLRKLHRDSDFDVRLHASRMYVLLFEWVKGADAEQWLDLGRISLEEVRQLTMRVTWELDAKGFRVLDNKPRHFILRETRNGQLLRRHGRLVYALIDFELLQRTEHYKYWLTQTGLEEC